MLTATPYWRRVALFSLGVGGGLSSLGLLGRHLLRRSLPPEEGTLAVAGIDGQVEIIRDRWGTPHIYAETEVDLMFAQGFVHAQDRLFQMDTSRRVGTGRLSEIVGPAGILSDRFARVFGWHRAAAAQVEGMKKDPDTWALAEAYAAGVNARIERGPLPAEFILLAYRPEPWSPYDSAAWGSVLAWGLSVNWATELLRARLIERLGPERAGDLTPRYRNDYPTIVPGANVGERLASALLDAYYQALETLPLGQVPTGAGTGSNNWVVNGQWTASGRPILANDPHLPPLFPPIWYENHLVGGRFRVTGFTSPGVPGVIIGHNERVAWGITNAFPDVQDLYVERFHPDQPLQYEVDGRWVPAEEVVETIDVRGRRQPVVERVRYTRHGPVVSGLIPGEHRDLALRWMCHEENNHMRALLGVCMAHDWDEFRSALHDWAFPSQNVVYADVEGNIGYLMPGRVPLRRRGEGLVPVPGWSNEYEWEGWIPFSELPVRFNPHSGYVVTANNRITPDDYKHMLTGEWLPPYRARRITTLIGELAPLTVEACGEIQQDVVSLLALRFLSLALPFVEKELPASVAEQLLGWGGEMARGQVAPSIVHGWLVCFTRAALVQAVGEQLAGQLLGGGRLEHVSDNPFHEIAYELGLRWLADGAPSWVGEVVPLLKPALEEALAILRTEYGPDPAGWQWGRLHVVALHNHLSRIPALGRLWRPLTLPLGGDGYTVNQAETAPGFPPEPVHVIASCRMILDVGAWDNSVSSLPGGQSGQLASRHYQDRIDDWHQGRYHPMLFSREAVETMARGHLTLQPEG